MPPCRPASSRSSSRGTSRRTGRRPFLPPRPRWRGPPLRSRSWSSQSPTGCRSWGSPLRQTASCGPVRRYASQVRPDVRESGLSPAEEAWFPVADLSLQGFIHKPSGPGPFPRNLVEPRRRPRAGRLASVTGPRVRGPRLPRLQTRSSRSREVAGNLPERPPTSFGSFNHLVRRSRLSVRAAAALLADATTTVLSTSTTSRDRY